VWLALIGWFVLQAAGAEAQMVRRIPRAVGPVVGDMMDADPVTTRPELTLIVVNAVLGLTCLALILRHVRFMRAIRLARSDRGDAAPEGPPPA
jgi:hypothetical protein